MLLLYVTLGLCAVFAAALVWRYDLYEREPWFMVLLAVALGIGAMMVAGWAETFTIDLLATRCDVVIAAIAATHEELVRLAVVAALAVFVSRQLNDPMDGIIYGSLVGVGMALNESRSFLDLWGTEGALPPSEPVRIFGHLVMGGITGYGVGLARMRLPRWWLVLVGCLFFSMALHFLWDWLAFTAIRAGFMTRWQTAAAVSLMVGGIVFYGRLVVRGSEHSQRVFSSDRKRSLWGWPFPRRS
jgi:RsiW-degrading membrane proteinase PrsW (M82 family)